MNGQILCSMHGISKVFADENSSIFALRDVDIQISQGEFISLIGPSGSGKSTLLAMLGAMDSPTEGTYFFGGRSVFRLSENERRTFRNRQVGFVFQDHFLHPALSLAENVALPLLHRGIARVERLRRASAALERVGLNNLQHRIPSQLSGGQKQRVAIARAFCGDPKLILADEPTAALDKKNAKTVIELLLEFSLNGVSIVVATHDEWLKMHTSRTVEINDGRIL